MKGKARFPFEETPVPVSITGPPSAEYFSVIHHLKRIQPISRTVLVVTSRKKRTTQDSPEHGEKFPSEAKEKEILSGLGAVKILR